MYIEAIAPGSTPSAKAAAQRRAVLFDTVNRLDDPNFMLWLDNLVEGANPPPAARLRADLRRWLAELDPDAPWDLESAPARQWQHDGWSLTFKPIPKKPEARGRRANNRAIGVYGHTGVDWIDDAPAIRKALTTKHHEYGALDAPFVITVGPYIHDRDRWHTTNAMYGAVAVELSEGPDGEMTTRQIRQPDGYFGVPPGWQHRNVSGVLLVNQLMPYNLQRAEVTLWRHPNPSTRCRTSSAFPSTPWLWMLASSRRSLPLRLPRTSSASRTRGRPASRGRMRTSPRWPVMAGDADRARVVRRIVAGTKAHRMRVNGVVLSITSVVRHRRSRTLQHPAYRDDRLIRSVRTRINQSTSARIGRTVGTRGRTSRSRMTFASTIPRRTPTENFSAPAWRAPRP